MRYESLDLSEWKNIEMCALNNILAGLSKQNYNIVSKWHKARVNSFRLNQHTPPPERKEESEKMAKRLRKDGEKIAKRWRISLPFHSLFATFSQSFRNLFAIFSPSFRSFFTLFSLSSRCSIAIYR
jgi:hypothetical protein